MSGPVNGEYRLRFIDLDHLPPGLGGEFATAVEEGNLSFRRLLLHLISSVKGCVVGSCHYVNPYLIALQWRVTHDDNGLYILNSFIGPGDIVLRVGATGQLLRGNLSFMNFL
jgi:hypothetical protein